MPSQGLDKKESRMAAAAFYPLITRGRLNL